MWIQEGNFIVHDNDMCIDCKFNNLCYIQEKILNNATDLSNVVDYSVNIIQCNEYKEDV